MKVRSVSAMVLLVAGLALFVSAAGAQAIVPQAAGNQTAGDQATASPVASTLKDDLERAMLSTQSFDALIVKAQKTVTGLWVLNVAASGVAWNSGTTDDSQHAEATVVAGWYDAENRLMGNLAQEESFKRVIPGGDAVYSLPVMVPAGAVRLRFVVRDALNGHMGTVDLTQF